ncbi:hypothetical protein BI364_14890 [Acidihalobacter yilgarnensis]|uniref:DUF1820 domain-containing protein n=1 Tax=Acidihalobacter yilgarnensis TaxID=2819280 RepID=A0A1D8IRN4_9GAMM|nr:DUF1820 family protein [Acidihalobacter yilgarnensis]AOU99055.1 hypothetical protein BI364_14890 [Acidihalobacter yilgarnensis]
MDKSRIYRIVFHNQGSLYELHARKIAQSSMYAFLEVEDIVFGERSAVLVDPAEERLKAEFAGVKRSYIPLQSVVRIDEVEKAGTNRILAEAGTQAGGKIAAFPYPTPPRPAE